MGLLHYVGLLMLLGATALMVVVSVSTPVWTSVYFLKAHIVGATSAAGDIKLGQWGACAAGACTKSKLGYNLDFITNAFPNNQVNLSGGIVRGLTFALIVNPIAAGFAFLALCAAVFPNTFCGVLGSILSFWAFLVTLVALGLDLGLFITARHRLENTGRISCSYGNALWMVVAAAGALLIASVTVCFTSASRKRQNRRDIETRGLTSGQQTTRRNWMGRKVAADPYNNGSSSYGNSAYDNNHNGAAVPTMMEQPGAKQHFWSKKQPVASTY